jgi:type IV pilus assembly protein PilO
MSESTILMENRVASRLDAMKADAAKLDLQLRQAVSQLTDKAQADDLLQNISNSAQSIGLELKLFQRKEERISPHYVEIPVAISVSGTFHEVGLFFDSVNRLPGLVTLDQVSLSNPRKTEARLVIQADCLMTAHRLLSPEERDQLSKQQKGNQRE